MSDVGLIIKRREFIEVTLYCTGRLRVDKRTRAHRWKDFVRLNGDDKPTVTPEMRETTLLFIKKLFKDAIRAKLGFHYGFEENGREYIKVYDVRNRVYTIDLHALDHMETPST